jgi:hypothetical protein
MPMTDYREALEEAVRTLHRVEIELFTAMVNVGFKGPYDDLSRLHDVGEVINLEVAMFEETGDRNVDLLIESLKKVAQVKQELVDINDIDIDLDEE